MYGIRCEVASCAHNCNRMCLSAVEVHLTESAVFGAVMLTCSEYLKKDSFPVEEAMQRTVWVRRENIVIN